MTATAFCELVNDFPEDSEAHKHLLEFEVISVYSQDLEVLICMSNALNLNIAKRVSKENFRSYAKLGRAPWKKVGCLEPHRGGGKSSAAYIVHS